MMKVRISPSNPIVFFVDPTNLELAVPEHAGNIDAKTSSCVSTGLQCTHAMCMV